MRDGWGGVWGLGSRVTARLGMHPELRCASQLGLSLNDIYKVSLCSWERSWSGARLVFKLGMAGVGVRVGEGREGLGLGSTRGSPHASQRSSRCNNTINYRNSSMACSSCEVLTETGGTGLRWG